MPSVLLITDLLKPREPLSKLEAEGILSLRVAPTLSQGEEEIAAEFPDLVFVQNRISGLSGELIGNYLRGLLPPRAQIVVLVQNNADVDEMRRAVGSCIDVSQSEPELVEAFRACILQEAPGAPAEPGFQQPVRLDAGAPAGTLRAGWRKPGVRILAVVLIIAAFLCLPALSYFLGKKSVRQPQVPAAVSEPASTAVPTAPAAVPGPTKAKDRH